MSEDIKNKDSEPMLVVLEDEDGKEYNFELVESLEHNEKMYHALVLVPGEDEETEEEEDVLVILKSDDDEGEYLSIIEDDEEYNDVEDLFLAKLSEDFDFVR